MTPQDHADKLGNEVRQRLIAKYLKGQKEHGGELWRKRGIIDMAIEEAIDQAVYLLTLKEQLNELERELNVRLGEIGE